MGKLVFYSLIGHDVDGTENIFNFKKRCAYAIFKSRKKEW